MEACVIVQSLRVRDFTAGDGDYFGIGCFTFDMAAADECCLQKC